MGSLREAARDRDWQGGLGLAHCRLGSVEFVVMIYRNQPPRYPDLATLRPREARRHGEQTRRLLTNRLAKPCLRRVRFQKNVYASAIGLYKDSMIMQSAKPSNSDFWRSFNMYLIPPRVRTVADKNSAVTPLHLLPREADQAFQDNSIEMRRQFNCTMNMPSARRATLP